MKINEACNGLLKIKHANGSIGTAVIPNANDPWFKSSHQLLSEKKKMKIKVAQNGTIKTYHVLVRSRVPTYVGRTVVDVIKLFLEEI